MTAVPTAEECWWRRSRVLLLGSDVLCRAARAISPPRRIYSHSFTVSLLLCFVRRVAAQINIHQGIVLGIGHQGARVQGCRKDRFPPLHFLNYAQGFPFTCFTRIGFSVLGLAESDLSLPVRFELLRCNNATLVTGVNGSQVAFENVDKITKHHC